jgi:Uma2 family endonuclease
MDGAFPGQVDLVIFEGMARPKATYADLERLPEPLVGELIGGELFASPRPAPKHALASSALAGELVGPFQFGRGGPGGWWILPEPELHFGEDVLVPDFAGWRRERLPSIPDEAFFTLAPDWICEILSPSTARLDRARKLPRYAGAQVRFAWIIDPLHQTLEALSLENSRWELSGAFGGSDRVRAPPFEAVEIGLESLWGRP